MNHELCTPNMMPFSHYVFNVVNGHMFVIVSTNYLGKSVEI